MTSPLSLLLLDQFPLSLVHNIESYIDNGLLLHELERVKQKWKYLEHVHFQTEEVCLAAVKKYGHALKLVKNQTEEICLAAVKKSGLSLQHVHFQTPEICLAAVKQSGKALMYVEKTN